MSATPAASEKVWRVADLLTWTRDHFASKGIETARLDAEVLLAFALGTERLRLILDYAKPVTPDERARFRELVRRRADERVPVAYLSGVKEFWSLPLRVTPDVLVPRAETETLVEAVIARTPDREAELHILDIGTGSGAIALALAKERPKAKLVATDLSEPALAVARANAEALGFADRIRFLAGDAFEPAAGLRFDVVVSNPPYVARADQPGLAPELAHEPALALFADADGSAILRRLVAEAPPFLAPAALFALELAPGQANDVRECLERGGFREIQLHRDLNGLPRAVSARWQ